MAICKTKWGYRAELMFKGKRYYAEGFFRYINEAREWVKSEKARLKENHRKYFSPGEDLSFWGLAQRYLKETKINHSTKTFDEKKYCLERFYKFIGDVNVTDVTPPEILDFLNTRAETGSNNSANKDRKNLKAFYSWVRDIYGVLYDPTAPLKKKPHTKKPRRLVPIQDILKVILAAQGHDRVLIEAYWHTGGRKSEVLRWTWADDVNFEERCVRLGTRKNRDGSMHYEKLWMNDDLHRQLMWQWKHRHFASPYVFCT